MSDCSCPDAHRFPGSRHVNGIGPANPRLMFIGEAPGANEDQLGEPFAGGSGRILNAWLGSAGLKREECYLDNVVQHRPPGNNFALCNPRLEASRLAERIRAVNPNMVVLLGNPALQMFVDGGITDWRGSVFPITVGDVVYKAAAELHPAFIMRQQRLWSVVIRDFRVFARESLEAGYVEPEVTYLTDASPAVLNDYVMVALDSKQPVAVDIETDTKFVAIDWVALCYEPGFAISARLNADTMRAFFLFFKNVKEVVTHNGPLFDAYHLRRFGIPCPPPKHDTMLYHHLLYPHLPHDLGFLCSIYTRYPFYKDQSGVRMSWYNARDADTTLISLQKELVELREMGLL